MAPPGTQHRRHHSELDMASLRRISEALLLAQNRARLATERATRSERLLRAVFARVDDPTAAALRVEMADALAGDALAWDWPPAADAHQDDLALAAAVPPRLLAGRRPLPSQDDKRELAAAAREVVASLSAAGARHRLLADREAGARLLPDARRPLRTLRTLGPLQLVAGLLAGLWLGAALARGRPSLVSRLSQWCSDRARVGRYYALAPAPLPFPLDELGFYYGGGAPAAIDVAS